MRFARLRDRLTAVAMGMLALAALACTTWRACFLSFTHDEAVTYLDHVTGGWNRIVTLSEPHVGNNHLLNSVLTRASLLLFGDGELALRLPNLLAHAGFLCVAATMAWSARGGATRLAAFGLLVFHPFMLEFFSLCRGYGLGVALLFAGLLQTFRYAEAPRAGSMRGTAAVMFVGLAATASLPLIIPMFVVGGLMAVLYGIKLHRGIEVRGAVRAPLMVFSAFAVVTLVMGRELSLRKALYAGVPNLWDCFEGALAHALYGLSADFMMPLAGAVGLTVCGGAAWGVRCFLMRHRSLQHARPLLVACVVVGWVTAVVLQRQLLGTLYPEPRMMMPFVPLVALLLMASLVEAQRTPRYRVFASTVMIVGGVVTAGHLALQGNLTHTRTWQYDADTRDLMTQLRTDVERHGATAPVRLRVSAWLEPSVNYYRRHRQDPWLEPVDRGSLARPAEYYLFLAADRSVVPDVTVIAVSELAGVTLGRAKAEEPFRQLPGRGPHGID